MRNLWITVLVLAITGCSGSGGIGNANITAFVATPVADEIRVVTYSNANSSETSTWRLDNDDLRIRYTVKSNNNILTASRTRKMTPNDYNWVVYNLEKANFTKAKSTPNKRQSQGNETLTVVTQANVFKYNQNSLTRFPNGFQKVINTIPSLSNAR